MKMIYCWILLLALVGCVKERSGEHSSVIRLQSELETSEVSRAVVNSEMQLAGVQFLRHDGAKAPISFSGATVLAGLRSEAGHITFSGEDPVYDKTRLNSYFLAFHPEGSTANEVVTWVVDGKSDILASQTFDAGSEENPITGPLVLKHRLAQLEVICKADPSELVDEDIVRLSWGAITKIELVDTPSELLYTYATNTVTRGATLSSLPLKNKDYDTDFGAVAVTKNAENTITAAGMFVPGLASEKVKLKVYTERKPLGKQIEVQLKNGETLAGFEMGLKHTVTLQFNEGDQILVSATSIGAWNETWGSGFMGNGVENQFVLQLLEPQATGYDYTKVERVRLTAGGVVCDFSAVTFVGSSNILVATTNPFAFTAVRPDGYPYTVQRVELLDASGSALGSSLHGVFDADVMVTRSGLITIQLFRGKATDLVSSTGVVAYGTLSSTDAPLFTSTVTRGSLELVYALSNGTPELGKEATSVSKAVVTVKSSSGMSSSVLLSPYTMVGTPFAARSSDMVDMVLSSGWPSGLRYPYEITHVALYDRNDNVLVAPTALSSPLEVYWSVKMTLSVTQAVAPVALSTEAVVYGLAAQSSVSAFTVTAPVGVKWRLSDVLAVSGTVSDFVLSPSSEQTGTGLAQTVTFSCNGVAAGALLRTGLVNVLYGNWFGTSMSDPVAISHGANVSIAPATNWTKVSNGSESREVIVTVAGASDWTASVSDLTNGGLTVWPTSGTSGTKATITWAAQEPKVAPANPARSGKVTFSSNSMVTSVAMTTDQLAGPTANPPAASNYVKVGSLYWATGNLVANGTNGCKVGASTDQGLYFQFGSLIGWKGGSKVSGGTGVGSNPYSGSYWGSSKVFGWANDVMVYPAALSGNPFLWPSVTTGTEHQWYFSGKGAPTGNINVTDATKGVGDPCAYYLGNKWRLPTNADYKTLCKGVDNGVALASAGGSWGTGGMYLAGKALFFSASGLRRDTGVYAFIGTMGVYWTRSFLSGGGGGGGGGGFISFSSTLVYPDNNGSDMCALPVRCVSSAP